MSISRFLCIVCLAALPATQALADTEVFRWVDEDGVLHYSDRPMDPHAERANITSRPTDRARLREQQLREWEGRQAAARAAADQPPEGSAASEADRQAEEARIREANCVAARDRLATYTAAPRLYETLPDGQRRYLPEEELDSLRARARAEVDAWCD